MIAIATNENFQKGFVDLHFGRCNWYCLYNTETKEMKFIENPVRHNQEKAGCDAAEMLVGMDVKLAVAGRFGSKVMEVFNTHKVQMVVTEETKTIEDVIKPFKKSKS